VAQIEAYKKRFGALPPYLAADRKYGTRENREATAELQIRTAFIPFSTDPIYIVNLYMRRNTSFLD
jgi:hypothetical protein